VNVFLPLALIVATSAAGFAGHALAHGDTGFAITFAIHALIGAVGAFTVAKLGVR
jgi:hypothetical protein